MAETAAAPIAQAVTTAVRKVGSPPTYADPVQGLMSHIKNLATSSAAGKEQALEVTKRMFPETWKETWKMIMAPRTRI